MPSLDQYFSYCIQLSSITPGRKARAEMHREFRLAIMSLFAVTYGSKIFWFSSSSPQSASLLRLRRQIVQFGDQTFHPRRKLLTTHMRGLTPMNDPATAPYGGSPPLNGSTPVDFFSRISTTGVRAPVQTPVQAGVTPRLASSLRQHRGLIRHYLLLHLPASSVSVKVNAMASLIQEVGETFFTLYKGFSVTLRTMFRKTTTESFPDAPPTVQPRYRGIHVLQRDEHGYEKCVGCFLCAAACPANC